LRTHTPFKNAIDDPATITAATYKAKPIIVNTPRYTAYDLRLLKALWSSSLSRVCTAWAVCFEKRNRKCTGKKYTAARTKNIIIITDSGIPALTPPDLKADKKVPAIIPIITTNPRNINPKIEKNIAHFLITLRFLRISWSISIVFFSGVASIE
jgi:hypothetical protein